MPLSLTIRRLLITQPIELPVFHPIATKLHQLLENPDFTIDEVATLANEDQSLAGQILKLANSMAYMGRVKIETIKEAVIRLGARQVSNLAMAASQAGLHVSENKVIDQCMQRLWLHSHASAMGSRWLAKNAGYPQLADQAYMAGLLHDVGKLYLLKALEKLNKSGVAQAALEPDLLQEIFVELHVDQGYRLMRHWNMPQIYCEVVAHHHAEYYDPADTILSVVRLVNGLCKAKGISLMPDPGLDVMGMPEAELLELSPLDLADLETVIDDSQDVVFN